MHVSVSYTEWCDERRFPYDDEERKLLWKKWCEEEIKRRKPAPKTEHNWFITRTWMQDRADELRRRSYRIHYRVIWPKHPLRIVRA